MDRWVTPPKRVTSPTSSPPPPCLLAWFAFGDPELRSSPTLMFSNTVNDRFWGFLKFFFRLIWNKRALDFEDKND